MTTSRRWFGVALAAGVAYLVIGRAVAGPAANGQAWRLAAWAASGVVFAIHIWHEHFRERQLPVRTAIHAAVGVAIGGFGLAVAGAIHAYSLTGMIGRVWPMAAIAFPVLTGIPAFIAAYVSASVLTRMPRASSRS